MGDNYQKIREKLFSSVGAKAPDFSGGKTGNTEADNALKRLQQAKEDYYSRISSQKKVDGSTGKSQEVKKTAVDDLWDRGSNAPKKATEAEKATLATAGAKKEYEASKNLYDAYMQSDERKKKLNSAVQESIDSGDEKVNLRDVQAQDTQENELKALTDHYKRQMDAAENQLVTTENLQKYSQWSEDEQKALTDYKRMVSSGEAVEDPVGFQNAQQAYFNLRRKYGEDEVAKVSETLDWQANEQQAKAVQERTAESTHVDSLKDVPGAIGNNLLSVPARAIGGVAGTADRAIELLTRTGQYSTLDPNLDTGGFNTYADTVRSQTAHDIAGDGDSALRSGLSVLYEGGMSMVDSLVKAYTLGPASLGLSAMESFSGAMSEASKQGATPAQAMIMAVGTAGIEVATEKIPLDELLKASGGLTKKIDIAKEVFKQAGIEAATEEVSLFGSLLWEAAVMREDSGYKQKIGDMVAQGMSYDEAKTQADKDIWNEAMKTAMASGVAGGGSGLVSSTVGYVRGQNAPDISEDATQEIPTEAAPADPVVGQAEPSTVPLVDGIQDMTPAPAPLTEGQRDVMAAMDGALGVEPAQQPTQMQTAEDASTTISEIIGKMNGSENGATNSMAEAILNDAIALKQLIQETGADVSGTKSEQRRAIKEALNRMFNNNMDEPVDSGTVQRYNNTRSEQAQSAIDRLNSGGDTTPSLEEIMAIPEIADAERANDGPETINLPNREQIRENGYRQAMQKGSWNGKDYSGEVRQERRMDIVIGLPGSGKSSVYTERLSQEHKSRVIDTDDFREYIPEYNGSNAAVVHEEASLIRGIVFDEAMLNGDNILLSTIGANPQKLEAQIAGYKELGYRIYLHLNELPNNKSLARAIGRYISEDGTTGRYVSPQLIASYGDKPTQTYLYLTGQGGIENGRLGSDLRKSGGYGAGENSQLSGTPQGPAAETDDLLEGYDWYNNDVARGEAPRLIQSSEQSVPITDTQSPSADGGQQIRGTGAAAAPGGQRDLTEQNPGTVGAMQSQFKHEVKQSKVYGNTYQNTPYADIHDIGRAAKKADPNIDQYDVITEAESVHEAELRTETGRDRLAEHLALMKKDGWTGADNDTAMRLLTVYRREGKKDRFLELSRKQRQMGTQAGQMVQSFAKYSREDATVAVQDAIADLDELTIDQVDRTFWKPKQETKGAHGKKDAFQKWKESITGSLLEVANDIENVEDGDKAAMKDLVRQIANLRHTTAWAGYSSDLSRRTERGLDKMDFDTLKTVAKTQLSMIPNDFRKRDIGEILKQIRVQNMLFTLTTKFKNDSGNITNGIMDAISDSFCGRMIDAVIGEWTGMRTVGNDLKYAAEYRKAARDAADVAAAFVSLDIPMETDAKYSSGRTRTWTPNTTNVFGRLMSAYEKHLKYALEVSDKFYEGGAAHVVNKSLQSLGEKSGLTPEQIQDIAQKTGERRTFKDPGFSVDKNGEHKNGRMFARANVGLQKALNQIGTENIGLGDLVMPFAAVSGEVKQVGMDYTGGGLISGMKEIIGIAKDVRNGKEIDPYRQRTAATNFGRGMTGVGLIAAFTALASAGAIKVHNDRDSEERIMNQTQGLSGAQWNLNSSIRWWEATMSGATPEEAAKAAEWQSSDELITIDFLEPFNTQMHIGYLLSQGEDIATAIVKGNINSLLEMPMMPVLSELADLQQAFTEVSDGDMDGVRDAAGQLVGTVAGSIVPNWMRKTAQVIDPYYRDTYDTNPFRKAAKEVVAATPFLSTALPKKYDNLGKEQRRFDDSEWMAATFDNLVTPWDTDAYQTNPVYREIERLNAIDGLNVTPPKAKRKITYSDNNGKEHENYNLSSEQYETMQRIQGQTTMRLLTDITMSEDYKVLNDIQKAQAVKLAYQYAADQGKRAALDDYPDQSGWMAGVEGEEARAIVKKVNTDTLNSAIEDLFAAWGKGWDDSAGSKALDTAYSTLGGMSEQAQKDALATASSETKKYLEARDTGISHEKYVEILKRKTNAEQKKGSDLSQGERIDMISGTSGLTDLQKETLLKENVSEPQRKAIDKVEEFAEENNIHMNYLRLYTEAYRAVTSYTSGPGKKDRTTEYLERMYGLTAEQADDLYDIIPK